MWQKLTSFSNLYLAYRNAARGKRGKRAAAAFEYRLEENLLALRRELRLKQYQPGQYANFYIHEPKRRLISAAPFRDRVVHHALCNLIEPLFESSFISDSFANRVGKGTHRGINRCQYFARRFRYVLQCDIKQFFPSIDHQVLLAILRSKIADADVLWLCRQIITSGAGVLSGSYDMAWFPGDDLLAANRARGLPIGNLTSQFWANVYLNPFDHFVKRELRCKGFLRYVDDFLLFADDKATLWKYKHRLLNRLADFRLTIHPGAQPRLTRDGVPFLGFIIFPDHRRLKRRKGNYYMRKLKRLNQQYQQGEIAREELQASIDGWVNHVRYANTVGLRKAVFNQVLKP